MTELIRQKKNKVFPHAPYDQYSHYSPVFGYFVDNDEKSGTFGEVLFGQIGERNDFEMVQSFKDDCDMTLIKQQLLKAAKDSDWNAEFVDYDEEEKDVAETETSDSANAPQRSDENPVQSGTTDSESDKKD